MGTFCINKEDKRQYFFTIVYCVVFLLCYLYYLNPVCGYAGFARNNSGIAAMILSTFIAAFPILFYRGHKAISGFISIFIYVLLYIPIIITFGIGSGEQVWRIFGIQIIFMFCMILLFCADKFILKQDFSLCFSKNRDITTTIFKTILLITIILTLYVVWVYKDGLKLVSFGRDVYELRSENLKYKTGAMTGYLLAWLSTLFIPICLTYGVMYKKRIYFIVACLASLIIYMATAAKIVILLPVLYLGCFWLFKRVSITKMYSKFVLLYSLALLFLLLVPVFSEHVWFAKSMVMWRLAGNGGYLTMWYYDFFSTHPYTYYSHINVINALTGGYPYDVPLGFVIGREYWSPLMNANANFWATDGIAAMGMLGVIFVTFLFFCFFVFLNTITQKINPLFVLLLMLSFLISILNASLFSSLVTGGGFFILLLFMILNSNVNITRSK